jgi:hypothetical protein
MATATGVVEGEAWMQLRVRFRPLEARRYEFTLPVACGFKQREVQSHRRSGAAAL